MRALNSAREHAKDKLMGKDAPLRQSFKGLFGERVSTRRGLRATLIHS
jgi:hypothetical protein